MLAGRSAQILVVSAALLAVIQCGGASDQGAPPTSPSRNALSPGPASGGSTQTSTRGAVGGLTGGCPRLSFTVNGNAVRTDPGTQFRRVACAEVRNGLFVEVEGVRQADGSILAREVEREEDEPEQPEVKVRGAIAGLAGACPNRTFTVNGERIATNDKTEFERITCAGLQNNLQIEVEGFRQPNGVILAREVEIEDEPGVPPPPRLGEVDSEGPIASLSGACPDRTFMVSGRRVTTNGATRFDHVTCETLQNGLPVKVRGTAQTDGTVVASRVERDQEGPPEDVRVQGSIAGLTGACPALSFSVNSARVATNGATRFDDVVCSGLQNGLRVEVRGVLQSGVILATRVKRGD